jgi:magnesium-transporting ATPase (P-type)
MVTGDNIETAVAIAKEAGIILSSSDQTKSKANSSRYRCMTGAEFRQKVGGLRKENVNGKERDAIKDIQNFREIVKELRVLARSTPMDKYILTTGLR